MGFRLSKRINLGDGVGLNVSKSGISPSIRTGFGSVSSRGYSIRTGIPGLSFRGGGKNMGAAILVMILIGFAALVVYNILYFLYWFIVWVLSTIFQAEGISYRNLFIVLGITATLSGLLYYNWPLFTFPDSAPKEVAVFPVYTPDIPVVKPKPAPKKKRAKKKKAKALAVAVDTLLDAKPVDSASVQVIEPVNAEPTIQEEISTSDSASQNTDTIVKKKKKRWWRRKGDKS